MAGLGDRIRRRREELGWTQQELVTLVKRAGGDLSQAQLSEIEADRVKRPRSLPELEIALRLTSGSLLKGTTPPNVGKQPASSDEELTAKLAETIRNNPSLIAKILGDSPDWLRQNVTFPMQQGGGGKNRNGNEEMSRPSLPVWASAEAGRDGSWVVDDHPVAYLQRPDFLLGVVDAFAIRVKGSSMENRYFHDEMLLIDPAKPVRKGDFCLFLRDTAAEPVETYALVKQLVRATERAWVVRQLNPEKEFDLARPAWRRALLVVGAYTDR